MNPRSPYSAAKAGGDMIARAYAVTHGLNVSITRCGNNYGPYQFPEKVVPLFVTNLLGGRKVPLYGDGGNVRDWVHVDDHRQGIRLVAERGEPGEVYHIAGTAEMSNRELTDRLLTACGATWDSVEYVGGPQGPRPPLQPRRHAAEGSRLRPRWTFAEGLADTVAWYRDHPTWWKPLRGWA